MAGIRMTGLISNMDTESIVTQLMEAQRTKVTKIQNKKTKLEWSQDKWKDFNTKLYKLYTDEVSKMRFQSSYMTKKATTSNDSTVKVEATMNAINGNHSVIVKNLASAQYVTSGKLGNTTSSSSKLVELKDADGNDMNMFTVGKTVTIKSSTGTKLGDFEVTEDSTISDFVNACKKAGLNASFDTSQKRLFISSKESGKANAFSFIVDDNEIKLGKDENTIEAKDCTVLYNGAELTSKTNSISINGLNFTAVSESAKDSNNNYTATTISVENDVDAVYNMIKGFFKSYNSLLSEMNTAYYASSAKGYEPLTDEEREAMTEDQIEKWETKIKDSLLRRDNTLGGIISGMKTALSGNVSVNGKTYSLSSFGIQTSSDYTEKGLLHIYGDSDDSTYSSKTDKLKTALQEDPDTVMKVLTTIMEDLRDTMSKKMEKTSLSSALTYYNDVDISKKIKNYETEISDWETKLESIENRYYSQFTAMEKALANLQSQSSALSGLLGTN